MNESQANKTITYKNLGEIYDTKHKALDDLVGVVSGLTAEQLAYHPEQGGWSVTDVLEHLSIVEGGLIRLITSLTEKAAAATGPVTSSHSFEVSLEPHLERSRSEKYITRENYNPTGTLPAADAMKHLREIQDAMDALRPRLEPVDPTLVRFPHWIFGPLDLAQWLGFLGVHEERHLGQLRALIASPGFPRSRNV